LKRNFGLSVGNNRFSKQSDERISNGVVLPQYSVNDSDENTRPMSRVTFGDQELQTLDIDST
jgi:hypothetical protein